MSGTFILTIPATRADGSGRDAWYVREPMATLPLWGIFLATVVIILLSAEAGFRLGKYQGQRAEGMQKAPMSEIVAAMLGLLAFMLGFTFSLAFSRFEVRRALVIDEANAIGTTFLRAGLLPEPHRAEVRKLLRGYVNDRIRFVQSGQVGQGIVLAEETHQRLWAEAVAVGEQNPESILPGLFISSLNEVIDLHAKRVTFGMKNRIPSSIWAALYFLAVCAIGILGYHTGLAGARRFFAIIPLVLAFAVVFLLVADLDRPQAGLLQVTQQPLVDLLNTLPAEQPESRSPRVPSTSDSAR